ncbi:MAG: 3-phosphoshikimate 1-carboxyvinyltransferase [Acidimicrobiales bacterium]
MSSTQAPWAVEIAGGRPLVGTLRPPGDKSISHRALIIGALGEGTTSVRGLCGGDDVARTRAGLAQLGVVFSVCADTVLVEGGRSLLTASAEPIDCANSGTTMRLLAGLAATLPWRTVLVGDASLRARPMGRIAEPLRAMGAAVGGRGPATLAPLSVDGGDLSGIDWTPPMASAQVKSAILLAGLQASGETVVREPVPTRTSTEDLLAQAGANISVLQDRGVRVVRVSRSNLGPISLDVPADPSQGAFWLVAACIVPQSSVRVTDLYAAPQRTGFLEVLGRMGARISSGAEGHLGLSVEMSSAALHGTQVSAAEIPSLDEVPILAVAAAAAEGTTTFLDVGELRVKESDRLATTVALVKAMGAGAVCEGDDLMVQGVAGHLVERLDYDCQGDHRLAMAGVVAALACSQGGVVRDFGSISTSYPSFLADLELLCGRGASGLLGEDRR